MRYLIQFLIPVLILVVVVYLLARTKSGQDEASEGARDTGMFILILVVGATVAVAAFFALQTFLA